MGAVEEEATVAVVMAAAVKVAVVMAVEVKGGEMEVAVRVEMMAAAAKVEEGEEEV